MEASEKTAWLSIGVNLLLVAIKAVLAAVSGSLAIMADAVHSMSDVVSAVVILVGIRISKRQTPRFPYGLYKVENLVALLTSVLILLAGYEILSEVFKVTERQPPEQILLAASGIGLTVVITWLFSRYELRVGRETGSPSLVADAKHVWTDMLSSLVILAALLGTAAGLPLDRYAALVVVVFIVKAAYDICIDAVRVLLDASLDHDSLTQIRQLVLDDPRVAKINQLRARNAGRYKFVELDVSLRIRELQKGHQVVEELKQRIHDRLENVDHVLVHYQPQEQVQLVMALPLAEDRRTLSGHFGEAPFFRIVRFSTLDGTITADSLLSNLLADEPKAKGIKVANWLLEQGLDLLVVREDLSGKGPGYVLGNAEVDIRLVQESDADLILEEVIGKYR